MLHAVHRTVGHGHLAPVHRLMLHRLVLHGLVLRGRALGKNGVRDEARTEDDAQRDQYHSPHSFLLGESSREKYAQAEASTSMT
jgi:hypothetical protein